MDFNTVVSTLRTLDSQQDQLASIQGTVAANLVGVYLSLGGGWEVRPGEKAGDLIPEQTWKEMRERANIGGCLRKPNETVVSDYGRHPNPNPICKNWPLH